MIKRYGTRSTHRGGSDRLLQLPGRAVPWTCLLAILATGPAAAQDEPARDTVRHAAEDSAKIPIRLDPIMVTLSKLPLRPSQTGFAVTVLPARRLEVERPAYAVDALRELPASFIDEALGPGGPAIIRLRGGEEVFTQILMDGVQVNENGGFFDFQGVTLANVDRIEVARGPQSALYGSSAVSGVVQFITAAGEAGPPRIGGTLEGALGSGQGQSFRGSGHARGGGRSLLYSAGAGLAYDRGIYDLPNDTWTRDGSLRLDAAPTDRLRVTGVARYIGIDAKNPVRDAGVTRLPLDPNAHLDRDRYVFTARARFDATPRWSHGLRTSAFRQDFGYFDERDDIEQPESFAVTDANLTYESDLWRATVEYVGSYATAPEPAEATFSVAYGGLWERESLASQLGGDFGDDAADFDRQSVAAFTDLRAAPHPRLDLLAGARVERYEGLDAEVTPRASAVFHAVPGTVSLRAAIGRAYKAPNLQQQFDDNPFIAPNPDLEPESSVSWEMGADLGFGSRLTASVTGFHQDYHNLIRTVAQEGETRARNRNVGESRAWGFEASLRYRLAARVVTGVDATRTWTEIVDNTGLSPDQFPEGGTLPFRPDLTVSGYVQAELGRDLELFTRAGYFGRQIVLSERFSGSRVPVDAYLRVDATLNYHLGGGRQVFVRLENLLDAEYETGFDRPGIPFTAALGLSLER